ncbi:NPCBM-associated, NEW3 domain of alpha-galactosidase [uncultured archaeon]|nr:NPCBM-associated, NEW3 domain of alpha-galactosidase [uncultured archaeon]
MKLERENMHKAIRLLAMLLSFSLFAGIGHASVNPKLVLENYTLSEDPALPGTDVVLKLSLANIDTSNCADRVSVQLSTSYPVSIDGSDMRYIGSICPNDLENGTVSFRLPIDPLAQTGTYPVSVLTTYEKDYNKFSESNTVNLHVGGAPSFTASVISSSPVDIYPGDDASITVNFQNNGASAADSAHISLAAPDGIDVKWAGSEQELGTIPARASALATFRIEAAKNTAPGIYPINATLKYLGEDKTSASQSFSLGMPLHQKAEFSADAKKNGPFVAGDDREIAITLKNTGSEEAKKLKIRIMPVFPFSNDGTVRYIESLAPGEEKDVVYMIHVDKDGTPGDQTAGMLIDFQNPQGKRFTDSIDLSLSLRPKNLGYYLGTYWWVIALLLIAAYIVKRRPEILRKLPLKDKLLKSVNRNK